MAKFFFHLVDGERSLSHDEKGYDFNDLVAAMRAAETVARDLVEKKILTAEAAENSVFQITDTEGTVLATFPVTE